ncbi:DUF4367 domain-containing protein [Neofamilia massiliensis]|uniref:DUF4367 domain-containing protein n=1 Tax=Neofamilia massiliensis TaxID=1673724 RepID=UPI0006BB953F|nr:DUF4367 domain-containing protein [Neofamilia massiliensis]
MNKIKEENFDSLLEKALEENFKEELASVKVEKFPLSKSFQNKMISLIKKEDKRKRNLLKKVAIYLLIFAGATSLLVNNNQGAKAAFQSLWDWANEYRKITWLDDHIAIDVKRKDEDNIRVEFKQEFIPDGYKVEKTFDSEYMKSYDIYNRSNKKATLNLNSTKGTGSIGIDNEHNTFRYEKKGELEFLIIEDIDQGDKNMVVSEYKGYRYTFSSFEMPADELVDLAEKIFEKMEKSFNEDNVRLEFKEEFIPDRYKVTEFEDLNKVKAIELINRKNTLFYITLTSTELTGSIGLDNEHIKYERKTINNRDYLIGIGENDRFGNLAITEYKGYYYEFHSYVSNIDEILDLAEKIFEKMEKSL